MPSKPSSPTAKTRAHQFKRDSAHIDALAAELVAMANTAGGMLLFGRTPAVLLPAFVVKAVAFPGTPCTTTATTTAKTHEAHQSQGHPSHRLRIRPEGGRVLQL